MQRESEACFGDIKDLYMIARKQSDVQEDRLQLLEEEKAMRELKKEEDIRKCFKESKPLAEQV